MFASVGLNMLITTSLLIGIFAGYKFKERRTEQLAKELANLKAKYMHAFGWHSWYGTYDLESFDGGKSWYAMEDSTGGARMVRGHTDVVFPGLLDEPGILRDTKAKVHSRCESPRDKSSKAPLPSKPKDGFRSGYLESQQQDRSAIRESVRKQSICMKLQPLTSCNR